MPGRRSRSLRRIRPTRGVSMRRTALILVLVGCAAGPLCLPSLSRADKPDDVEKLNKKIDPFTLSDAAGKPWSLSSLKGKKAVVVVFLSFECPVSNSYAPTLTALYKKYGD